MTGRATDRVVRSIAPPGLLLALAASDDPADREAARRTQAATSSLRARRMLTGQLLTRLDLDAAQLARPGATASAPDAGGSPVTVYDAAHGGQADLPGTRVRGDGDAPVADTAVDEAYDGARTTVAFYADVLGRHGIDDHDMEVVSSVHYGTEYENAMWDGTQMVYGDGGGQLFKPGALTTAIDVIAHELTHGVTQFTAALEYRGQSGALNESWSDCFGAMVKQHALGETSAQADWLIGEGILLPRWGTALRSMKAPGTAWDGDDQPADMAGYRELPDDNDPANDNGGVHTNSGIPNRAFQLTATALGGRSWDRAGPIWYRALTTGLTATAQFADAARATADAAAALYDAAARTAVEDAWRTVGVH